MLLPSAIFPQMEVCVYIILNLQEHCKMEEDCNARILGNRVQEFQVKLPHGRFLQRGCHGERKRDDDANDEKKNLVEATREFFFFFFFCFFFFFLQKHSSYSFPRNKLHYRPTMLEYCLIWRVAYLYNTTDFPSKEDSAGSTQIYKPTKKVSD